MDEEEIFCAESTPQKVLFDEAIKYRLEELALLGTFDATLCVLCLTAAADHVAASQPCRWKRYVCARACTLLFIFKERVSNYKKMCAVYKQLALTDGEMFYLRWDVRRVLGHPSHSEPQVPQSFAMLPLNHGYRIGLKTLERALE